MHCFYNLAIFLYAACAWVVALFSKKVRKMVEGHCQTYNILKKNIAKEDRVVWFHAASLGEFEQGRPIIERVKRERPELKVLLTFFSPSGYEVCKHYEGADVVCYLPFDLPGNAHWFVRMAHPEIAVFIKYEFWENYLRRLHKRGTKIYSVSSVFRQKQYFFRWWGSPHTLYHFDRFFVQNEHSKQLLAQIGIDKVQVTGDTRFDRVLSIRQQAAPLPLVEKFIANSTKVFIAGSSWEADEDIYIPYFLQHPDWRLIIAPHVVSSTRLHAIEKALSEKRKCVRYSCLEKTGGKVPKGASVLIIDCYGKLASIYRYGQVALIGGGFGAGIHNVPEAAVYGLPILFGPNNKRFVEAQALLYRGGAFEYNDANQFARIMDGFIAQPATMTQAGRIAGKYIADHAGAADACFDAIFQSD